MLGGIAVKARLAFKSLKSDKLAGQQNNYNNTVLNGFNHVKNNNLMFKLGPQAQ